MSKKGNMYFLGLFVILILIFFVNDHSNTDFIQLASFIFVLLISAGLAFFSFKQKNKPLMAYFLVLMLMDVGLMFYLII
ncbi:hypothetical protein [Planomicrobium sp. CPCC 101079]|uniref:hypothetical protein n=1 Tax=Planomicrobium sp. CPCC 101079 TaxID=2599618 RepID=UPI0011B3FF64|nr:hypothetical protein [Planomicrobium sp. CPCC 101079]TWT09328.1 hypothetical protein FQV28_06760 [Planomicrobium sp. CPCC 101079]